MLFTMALSIILQRTVPVLVDADKGIIAQATTFGDLMKVFFIIFKYCLAPILQRIHKKTIKLGNVLAQTAQLHIH